MSKTLDLLRSPGRRPKIGLALGAGAARGMAHLGVLLALDDAGVTVDCVAGTSVGALIGAVYASGQVDEFREFMLHLDWRKVLHYFSDLSLSGSGLVDGKKVADFVREYISQTQVEDLPIPFRAVATDLEKGQEVVLATGDLIDAIRASIALPGVFTPVVMNDRVLVDGGLVNPVPVRVVRDMGADLVIAVDVNHDRIGGRARHQQETQTTATHQRADSSGVARRMVARLNEQFDRAGWKPPAEWFGVREKRRMPHLLDILGDSIRILEARVADAMLEADRPEILIRPDVGHLRFMDFVKAPEAVAEGYAAALPALQELAAQGSR